MKAKRFILILLSMVLCMAIALPTQAAGEQEEQMNAVWVASVLNIDFPLVQNNAEVQKSEIDEIMDNAVSWGLNTVIVQVCPTADALYESEIYPWSDVLTGVQGKDPGYDPLEYMINSAHERGLELHAWVNPYRVTHSADEKEIEDLTSDHPAQLNPDWVFAYEDGWYFDPLNEEVKAHVVDVVSEIVQNYDVDGIHFDDYFYPSGYPLSEGEQRDGTEDNLRRESVNDMVRRVGEAIDEINDEVEFGISPFGIWKNESSDPNGSKTSGNESYYSMACDPITWINEGYVDYIVPQIYWIIGHEAADYKTLVDWWVAAVGDLDVSLYIGQGIYNDDVAEELTDHLLYNEQYDTIDGNVYYGYTDMKENNEGSTDVISAYIVLQKQMQNIAEQFEFVAAS